NQGNLVLADGSKILYSTFLPSQSVEVGNILSKKSGSCSIAGATYLWDQTPLLDLDQKTVATLAAFQTSKQTLTADGDLPSILKKWGFGFLGLLLLFGSLFYLDFFKAYGQLSEAIAKLSQGDLSPSLPTSRPDEWGTLSQELKEALDNLREKDRISLILGKV